MRLIARVIDYLECKAFKMDMCSVAPSVFLVGPEISGTDPWSCHLKSNDLTMIALLDKITMVCTP